MSSEQISAATYSPALVLLFVWALLWIAMDIHFSSLTPLQKWLTPTLILLLSAMNHILRQQIGTPTYGKIIVLTMHLPFFLLFLYITKCGIIKMAFMIFSALIFTAPTVIISGLIHQTHPDSPWILLISNLFSYAAILLLVQFVFRKGFNYLLKFGTNRLFFQFSLVPLLYYIYVFAAMNIDFSSFTSVSGLVVRYLPTLEIFIFYFLLLAVYKNLSEKRSIEISQAALRQQLVAAKEQLTLLNEAQAQTAIYQHDMRHHLLVLENFLSVKQYQQAEEYINKVRSDIETITPHRFCENELVNLLCSSFSSKAHNRNIALSVNAKLPASLPISDTELCSVLSNSLENALRAADALDQPLRWVKLFCGIRLNKLLIEVQNPYSGNILIEDGIPASHQQGHGFGCRSIAAIAQHYNGLCVFKTENGIFQLQFMLPLESVVSTASSIQTA